MKIFKLPDLGEGLPDAEIHEWFVKEGDEIKTDQPLVSMETAKAVVDVPSPRDGKILKLYGAPGDIINTGEPLVEFETGDVEESADKKDSGTVVGKIETSEEILDEAATGINASKKTGIKAMPAVRALAKKLNVDLTSVAPTGANGQITKADVEKFASKPTTDTKGYEPLRGVRRQMAIAMQQSHQEIVPVTLFDDADIDSWPEDTDITIKLIRAVSSACKEEPQLNSWYDGPTNAVKRFEKINIGLAMDSPEGLFVPVLKDVTEQSDAQLRKAINTFKQQVKDRTIPSEDLKDATITLSNFGMFAGRYATPIIVPPMVAILGTGQIKEEVVATSGKPAVHKVLPLSLTFDHRAVTGGESTRFLAAVIKGLA